MKHLKSIVLIGLIPILTFCTFQSSENNSERSYTSAELLGKWNRSYSFKSLLETDVKIESIHFVNDSIAELQINNSTGERKITGTWEKNFEKGIGKTGIKINSDIRITYFLDENHPYMLLLSLSEKKGELIMFAGNYTFQKE